MLARLIGASLAQRLLVIVLALLLVGLGARAALELPIDAFPDVSPTQVKIIMKAPGMTPEEVEARIVQPLEQELLGIPRQRLMRSVSKYAIADVTLDFEDGTDIYWARQQVAERLANAQDALPPNASGGMAPITTPLGEMYMFTVEGPLTLAEKRTLVDWTLRPLLRSIPGVAEVNALGGAVRAFEVVPDPAKLAARGVSLSQLQEALAANNRNDGAGRLPAGEEALLVRSDGSFRTLDDVRRTAVIAREGYAVTVADLADVRIGELTRYGAVTRNGEEETAQALVLGLRGANAREVVAKVREKLDEAAKSLPPGVTLEPFYDRGALVTRATGTVMRALAEAVVLVLALLFVFLGNLRGALVVAAVLPLSALATFLLMRNTGLTANLMSLGGLAIAIGMLVDTAVVVVENVENRLAHGERTDLASLVRAGAAEVAKPVASGVLIIMLVFVPLLTLEGLEGKLFAPVALTIVYAMGASLLLSLTVIPVLCSLALRAGRHQTPWVVARLNAAYEKALAFALAHRAPFVAGAGIALAAALAMFLALGKTFMPTMDEGDVIVGVEQVPSINLGQAVRLNLALQKALLEVPEVRGIVARSGSDELGLDPMGLNQTDTFLVLAPREEWTVPDKNALLDRLREVLARFPGVGYAFTQPIEMRVNEMILGVRGDLAVKVFGPDLGELARIAEQVREILQGISGSEDVLLIRNAGVQYLQVDFDRLALGRFGMTVDDAQSDLRALLEGRVVGIVLEQGRRTPVLVRGADALALTPELFKQLKLPAEGGRSVALASVATLRETDGPVKIDREGGQRYAAITANVRGRDLVGFVADAQRLTGEQVKLPPGYRIVWSGQYENQQRAAKRLSIVIPVSLGLIFLILYSTFGSLRQATLVFVNVPFALVGGVFGLALAGEYLSVPASVGFIALMGIAVLNGLVMVNHFNDLLAAGHPIAQVVREGAVRRLRPVLMTASIAAFGLVPLLFQTGPGSEIQRPLAIVVISGLVSCTVLTLLLLPMLFERFGAPRRKEEPR